MKALTPGAGQTDDLGPNAAGSAKSKIVLVGDRTRRRHQLGRMLITLAKTTTSTATEMIDCKAMSAFARTVSGIVSVGLNATRLVNATYRWSGNRGSHPGAASPLVTVWGNWKSG